MTVYNLVPYSFFNAVSYQPPTVMFSGGVSSSGDDMKDSIRNIESTGEFVCNLATWHTREQVNQSSATVAADVDEFQLTRLTPIESSLVKAPSIKEAPAHLECRYLKTVDIPGWKTADDYKMIIGEVAGIHINDDMITENGLVGVVKMKSIGRLGYGDYTLVDFNSVFEIQRLG